MVHDFGLIITNEHYERNNGKTISPNTFFIVSPVTIYYKTKNKQKSFKQILLVIVFV